MKIIFIGTGDALNSGGKANQAFLIETEEKKILIDCGPTTLYRLRTLGIDLNEIDGILFTHYHGDHFLGVIGLDLTMTLEHRSKEMIYAGPHGLKSHFPDLYSQCYKSFYPNDQFVRKFVEYNPNQVNHLWNIGIESLEVLHSQSSLGYRLHIEDKIIAITGDTAWCEGIAKLAEESDLFICECEYYLENREHRHLSYEILKNHTDKISASRTLLVHCGEELLREKKIPYL